MNAARKRKIFFLLFVVCLMAVVTGLILYALRQNISLFYTPSQIAKGEALAGRAIRLGGMVVKGSIKRSKKDLFVQFKLTDYQHTITVHYKGILPDLFREGQGIVAMGELNTNQEFTAKEVLAKHDANYMPREVKDALKKEAKNEVKQQT